MDENPITDAVSSTHPFPPAGFVEKSEVARLCGVNAGRIWKWEQRGLLGGGRMVLKPGTRGLVKVFPEETVRRLLDERRGAAEAPFPPDGFVDTAGAAALLGISPTTLHVWVRQGRLRCVGKYMKRPNGACKVYNALDLERARGEMAAEDAKAAVLLEGFVDRDGAAALLGVHVVTLNAWEREGCVRCGTWIEQPDGKRRKVYPVADLEREREAMAVARADRSKLPEGFVDQEGACRILGVAHVSLNKWQREGKVDFARWGRSGTYKPCRIYALDDLDRFMARMRETEAFRDREKPREYHVPPGYVRMTEAAHLFGVEYATFHRWELEGRITCGTRDVGAGIKLYPIDELKQLLEECGKYSPPYPDPQRPGVGRVPLAGRDMERREAIIDAADVSLLEGKRCHWSDGRPDQPGQVIVWDGKDTIRLRQLIMDVSGMEWRVGHRNGDPLDCRRENLFVRTKQEQGRGARKMKCYGGQPCSSRFKGVHFEKRTGRWRANIVVDGKAVRLGRFRDELAAAEAYDEAARELFGEHARLNFPDGVDAWLARGEHRRTEAEATRTQRAEAA